MTFPLNFGTDIKTRVVLSNETSHTSITQGMAGKVGVIGAFPTDRTDVVAVSSYPEFLSEYNLKSTKQEDQYDGMRALKYIFMTQFPNIPGATSVTCVNINGVYSPESDLTVEANDSVVTMKADVENRIAELNSKIATKKQRKQTLQNKTNKTPEETAELAGLGTEEPNNSGEYVGEIGALAKERDTLVESLATFNQLVDKYVEEGIARISADRHLTFNKLKTALTQLAEEDLDLLFISSNLWDCTEGFDGDDDEDVDSKGQARHIGIVYEYILNFINEGFSSHHPISYIGQISTKAQSDIDTFKNNGGLGTGLINVEGNGELPVYDKDEGKWDFSKVNSNDDWGAKQIASMFTNPMNELSTCGLYFQNATINDEAVGPMEVSAHICGWIAGMRVHQDITYQTIPGLTQLGPKNSGEIYFGEKDAGTILNNYGIQIIKPKNRLDKTYYVNNSIMPSGWHTNHVRSVMYLLKKYAFEAGLGINNFTANVEAFRASLEAVSKEVLNENELIRSIAIGDLKVINNYHIFVPIDIILAGVVTKISVGVSMALDETGTAGATQTTTGYSFFY